jgi:hypothetical protein
VIHESIQTDRFAVGPKAFAGKIQAPTIVKPLSSDLVWLNPDAKLNPSLLKRSSDAYPDHCLLEHP